MRLRDATQTDFDFVAANSAFPQHSFKEPSQSIYCVALEQDNDVVAVGGLAMITTTTAWAFCEITTFATEHKIELVRNMRDYLDMMILDLGLTRLQAWVDPSRPEAIKLVKHLGFVDEFIMKDFLGFDKPAIMFVKLTGA
jgi:hypothetical protein